MDILLLFKLEVLFFPLSAFSTTSDLAEELHRFQIFRESVCVCARKFSLVLYTALYNGAMFSTIMMVSEAAFCDVKIHDT